MNFHSYGESPSKSVRIITGQSVLIDRSINTDCPVIILTDFDGDSP